MSDAHDLIERAAAPILRRNLIEESWPDVLASMHIALTALAGAQEAMAEAGSVAARVAVAFGELAPCWARIVERYDDAGLDLDELIRADLIRDGQPEPGERT